MDLTRALPTFVVTLQAGFVAALVPLSLWLVSEKLNNKSNEKTASVIQTKIAHDLLLISHRKCDRNF
jgi:hypothetical protein